MKEKIKHNIFDKMSNFELSRWIALFEAVNIIAEKANDVGSNFENINIKQPAIEKYIESSCDNICRYLDMEKNNDK